MAEKLIVVVGATGSQASGIARDFAQKPGWRVRGLTREPSRATNAWLRDLGVELVKADLNDPASLDAAFKGANVIYSVTNFRGFAGDGSAEKLATKQKIPMNLACMHLEIAQGKKMADAAVRVIQGQGTLERYIWSTLSDSLHWSRGEIIENYHFDSKFAVERYVRDQLPGLAARSCYLMAGFYASNWKIGAFGPQRKPNGSWVHTALGLPGYSEAVYPIMVPQSDGGVFVEGLIGAPAGTTLLGFTEFKTISDFAASWARATGQRCRVEHITPRGFLSKDGSDVAREIVATNIYAIKFRYQGYAPDLKYPADIGIDVKKLTTLDQFMYSEDWSQLLQHGGKDTIQEIASGL